jgi:hypothetical protein
MTSFLSKIDASGADDCQPNERASARRRAALSKKLAIRKALLSKLSAKPFKNLTTFAKIVKIPSF